MNKKPIIIGIIIVVILAILAGGFWKWKEIKKEEEAKRIEEQKKQEEQKQNNNQNQQISEDQLIWYDVPELGIRFKVTPDAKEDLKYVFENKTISKNNVYIKYSIVSFYSESVKKFIEKNSKIKRLSVADYGDISIVEINDKNNEKYKNIYGVLMCGDGGRKILNQKDGLFICLIPAQADIFDSKEQGDLYNKETNNKIFGEFFDTTEIIN